MDEPKEPDHKALPLPGEVFQVAGRLAFLISPDPRVQARANPWVWYAPVLEGLPGPEEEWMFRRFLGAGISIAGIDVGESYGNPEGRRLFSLLYDHLVRLRGLSEKACLLARSRGALMLYNWAVEHPRSVACVAGIYPACNLTSYPGLAKACGAYGLTEGELGEQLAQHNPVDRVIPLARAGVPIYHIHGDSDDLVPLSPNSGELTVRYRESGGHVTLNVIRGQGHNRWPGWFQCQDLVDFVVRYSGGQVAIGGGTA